MMKKKSSGGVRSGVKKVHAVALGDLVKDRITGFTGVAVAKTEWINGCLRWTLQPTRLNKDRIEAPTGTFDHEQVVVVRKKFITSYKESLACRAHRSVQGGRTLPGGPRPSPSRPPPPTRR